MKFFLLLLGQLAVLSQINADCVQDIQEAKPHDVTNICTNQINWALLPHPHDCHKFYVCANHVPEEFTCERHYYFDTEAKRCVRGSCNAVKACQNWVRAADNDCYAFEICQNGEYERHACTEDHYFNAELGLCEPIERTPQHMCSCLLPEFATIENPNNCESYYVCQRGRAVERQCARGSYFNKRLSACIVDLMGVCVTAPTMSPQEVEMLETCERLINTNEANNNAINFVPDAENCEKFYMCVNGRVVAKECPNGFYYDREAKYCEYDSFGICEAMREEAEKKQEQAEKEAAETEAEKDDDAHHNEAEAIEVQPPKPPVHLSLSYTHLKVEADKGAATEPRPAYEAQHANSHADSGSVEVMHTADLFVPPVPPILLKHPAKLSQIPKETEMETGNAENVHENVSAEKEQQNDLEKSALTEKLQSQLKVPGNSAYDKLASKFIAF